MRLELFFRHSGDDYMSCDCPRAGWTRIVISMGSETDHCKHQPKEGTLLMGERFKEGTLLMVERFSPRMDSRVLGVTVG